MVNDKLDQIKLLSQFTESEAIKATNIIWEDIQREYKSLSSVSKPEGIITGGTPGAGKSVFVKLAKNRLNDNLLVIDGDQYRKFHPNFAKLQKLVGSDIAFVTGPFYGKMVRNILTKAMEHKYNVIIESTFKSVDSPLDYLKTLKANGYTTTVNIIAVDTDSSSNSFSSNANYNQNGTTTRDMVNREIEKTKNEDSVTSTETSSNKALHTIKEFKIHNLKSNEDEE